MSLDITSYILGKKKGGGGTGPILQSKTVTITQNGTTTVSPDAGYDGLSSVQANVNVGGGDDYFIKGTADRAQIARYIKSTPELDISNVNSLQNMFSNCINLTNVSLSDTTNVTDMLGMFAGCDNLTTIPQFNTVNVTNMATMFYNCYALTTVPLLNTSKVTNMNSMFTGCRNLSNDSLYNILAMCINATSYTGTKMLTTLGFNSANVPYARIVSLSNYQDFVNAGWSIGY